MAAKKKARRKVSGKKTKKKGGRRKMTAMEFLVANLKRNKNAVYGDLLKVARKRGLTIYPVMFGRAKVVLGMVKAKPRVSKKAAKKTAAKRGPGRPRKVRRRTVSSNGAFEAVREVVAENKRLRGTVDKMRQLLGQ